MAGSPHHRGEEQTRQGPSHREWLRPAWWVWVAAAGFAASWGVVVLRYSATGAVVTSVLVLLACAAGLWSSSPAIVVAGGTLTAGRARIPVRMLARIEVLDADGMRQALGPGLDARAYLCVRGWVHSGVRVWVDDPDDPTPYWVVATRRPAELTGALRAAGCGALDR